jgi:uncharacterized protein YdhG (YjbR/CyaY superfamily)
MCDVGRMAGHFASIDDYIQSFPKDVQVVLEQVRATIHTALPGAAEKISYNIPAITLDYRAVVQFAGWKQHISIYPAPDGGDDLERSIARYRSDRSTLKFPLREAIPYDLVARIATALAGRGTPGRAAAE